ncbi:hypothetical protein [Mycobacterium asiaticum]|nr:hypothetical protein [Mycobacterium asiaticum]
MVQRFLRLMNMVGPRAELFGPSTMLRMVAQRPSAAAAAAAG